MTDKMIITSDHWIGDAQNKEIPISEWSDEDILNASLRGNHEATMEMIRRDEEETAKAVEPDIIKVRRNAIARAVSRLENIPDDDTGRIPVPWIVADRPKIPTDDWADADLRSMTITTLIATQPYVNRETIIWHLEHLNDASHDNRAMPNILVRGDEHLIYDGHHRLVALWLLGAEIANCWTLEI